ncbi:Uncharacterised protein [Candidatus Tiddalikarchaeum anstoanum]|nr:Uncharacterised protein [Candidatus Tiddalikarchaeum anstoanum]
MEVRGNFLGAAILVIIYTVYIIMNMSTIRKIKSMGRTKLIILLVVLNALFIILMHYAFL